MGFIKIDAIGNLTRDPELRVTPKGTAICQFGIAANKKWKDESGQEREDVCFVDVEAWGKQAETIAKHFSKGKPIYIHGALKLDTWEDKQSGQKRSKHKIVLASFEFIGGREEKGGQAPVSPAPDPRPRPYGDGQEENPTYGRPAPTPRQVALPGHQQDINDEDVPF